ncbi:urease subunit beta [Defluviimonas aestuarii]|uniref:urease subunit beta n=1 Tax=Albidovulum aestuarii TaxID=1130726 RepID=UPI00249AAEDB|nr:urease subunit beta [Defluviimonas aestuarii]MDI3335648.1 urease subunit beta [Defluviimonas aestuarii]
MYLSSKDEERLRLFLAAELARRRKARGLQLTYPEAYALIADDICEGARDGKSVAELMSLGTLILTESDVLPGVSTLLETIMVEAMFEDGQKLVCVHNPIQKADLPASTEIPGKIEFADTDIEINSGRKAVEVTVVNTGDRPIQVGSHFHFFEVNSALRFDRSLGYGRRLAIPAGTAVRFEPGADMTVQLIEFGGKKAFSKPETIEKGDAETT